MFAMVNQQEFTKTANCWGVRNNAKGTNTNRIAGCDDYKANYHERSSTGVDPARLA
jgi:hypothetical protein